MAYSCAPDSDLKTPTKGNWTSRVLQDPEWILTRTGHTEMTDPFIRDLLDVDQQARGYQDSLTKAESEEDKKGWVKALDHFRRGWAALILYGYEREYNWEQEVAARESSASMRGAAKSTEQPGGPTGSKILETLKLRWPAESARFRGSFSMTAMLLLVKCFKDRAHRESTYGGWMSQQIGLEADCTFIAEVVKNLKDGTDMREKYHTNQTWVASIFFGYTMEFNNDTETSVLAPAKHAHGTARPLGYGPTARRLLDITQSVWPSKEQHMPTYADFERSLSVTAMRLLVGCHSRLCAAAKLRSEVKAPFQVLANEILRTSKSSPTLETKLPQLNGKERIPWEFLLIGRLRHAPQW
ncbi:hypothetical protein C8R46DRAFT_1024438 [Mycena filopes]|nr:hypothetical protein C8R46DRAFT_1024438 [Mycena filopes]